MSLSDTRHTENDLLVIETELQKNVTKYFRIICAVVTLNVTIIVFEIKDCIEII